MKPTVNLVHENNKELQKLLQEASDQAEQLRRTLDKIGQHELKVILKT